MGPEILNACNAFQATPLEGFEALSELLAGLLYKEISQSGCTEEHLRAALFLATSGAHKSGARRGAVNATKFGTRIL